jgi:hypothetical protein
VVAFETIVQVAPRPMFGTRTFHTDGFDVAGCSIGDHASRRSTGLILGPKEEQSGGDGLAAVTEQCSSMARYR